MKTAYFTLSNAVLQRLTAFLLLILILNLSACDQLTGSNTNTTGSLAVEKKATEKRDVAALGTRTLVLMHNIVDENINIRIDGNIDPADNSVKITFDKVGAGSDDAQATSRLNGIKITEEVNSGAYIYRIDSQAPAGTRVNATISMPRDNAVRLQMMAGKIGIYNVDGAIDVQAWRAWTDILTGSNSVKVAIEEGDTAVKMYQCKQSNVLDVSVLKGSAVLTIPRTINPPAPQSAALNATTAKGKIQVTDLDLLNKQETTTQVSGSIDRAAGSIKAYVGDGTLTIESWKRLNGS